MIKTVLLIIITIFLPPVGVFLVAGCGADVLINILLTCLGYLPGHIHAFYVEYMYRKRRAEARAGVYSNKSVPGVFSKKVHNGGFAGGAPPVAATPAQAAPQAEGYSVPYPPQQGYIQNPPPPPPPPVQQQYGTV